MKKAKILVTGGAGYIGSHTAVELLQAGYEVVIIDNFSNSTTTCLEGIEEICGKKPQFFEADMREEEAMMEIFHQHPDIKACIHFAAFKAVGESHDKPLMYYDNNLKSLMNLLAEMTESSAKNLVFSSSCTVYGNPDVLPVNEEAEIKEAMSPYGNTKRISEEIIRDVVNNQDMNCIALRYFNPIGAHPSGKIGELPQGIPNNLMPFITQTALGIREELKIFGNDYDTKDGTCIRDYIDVVDLAKAHVIAVERVLEEKNETPYEYFNLGTGRGVTVLEMVETFERVASMKLNYSFAERRTGDVPVVYADTQKANEVLDWKAEKSLEETITSAWNWEVKYRKTNQHE